MRVLDRRALRVVLTITLFAIALALVYFAWQALVAIIFAFLFGYLLEPVVKFVERRVWRSRLASIGIAYLVFVAAIAGAVLLLQPKVTREVNDARSKAPEYWNSIRAGQMPAPMASQGGLTGTLDRRLVQWGSKNHGKIEAWIHESGRYAVSLAEVLLWSIVVLVLGVFVLKDKDAWIAALTREPDDTRNRRRVRHMLVEIDRAMSRYIWAQVILSLIAFGVFAVVLPLLGLPFPLLLAAVQGLLEFVFVFGPLVAGIAILAAALFTGHNLLATFLFLVAWRIVQDYVNTPLLFGKRLEMHPLIVVIILMIGWSLGNVIGMFLAVPIAAAVQIAWETWSANGSVVKDVAALFEERRAA